MPLPLHQCRRGAGDTGGRRLPLATHHACRAGVSCSIAPGAWLLALPLRRRCIVRQTHIYHFANAHWPASMQKAQHNRALLRPPWQAGFDGPLIVELTMLRLLVTIYQAGGGSRALHVLSSRGRPLRCKQGHLACPGAHQFYAPSRFRLPYVGYRSWEMLWPTSRCSTISSCWTYSMRGRWAQLRCLSAPSFRTLCGFCRLHACSSQCLGWLAGWHSRLWLVGGCATWP